MNYPIFTASVADEFGRSLLGEPADWSKKILVVYASMSDEFTARQRASKYPNGLAVASGLKLNEYIRQHGLADIVFVNKETRQVVYEEIGLNEEFRPLDEYMEEWAEVSGRDFLGTP